MVEMERVMKPLKERKIISKSIKTTPTINKWMKKNQISPQLVFDETIRELLEKSK